MILEREIEAYLVLRTREHGGLCLKFPASFYEGFPDRIVLLPKGRIAFVEVKRPKGGRVAPLQLRWGEKLKALGFPWLIANTKESIDSLIKELTL